MLSLSEQHLDFKSQKIPIVFLTLCDFAYLVRSLWVESTYFLLVFMKYHEECDAAACPVISNSSVWYRR